MPVETVTTPSSATQVTFRQATLKMGCQARHMARVEANFLVHASIHFPTPCLVKILFV